MFFGFLHSFVLALNNQEPHQEQPPTLGPVDPEKNWIIGAHLLGLTSLVSLPGFIGPLVIYLMKKDESPRIAEASKESLNFQISMMIYALISFILTLFVIGFFTFIATAIMAVVFPIIASVKASEGQSYRYPLTIRFVN